MKLLSGSLVLLLSFGAGCSKKDESDGKGETKAAPTGDTSADPKAEPEGTKAEAAAATDAAPEAPAASDGLKMVEFPNTSLDAKVGQYVFSPNDSSFKSAHEGPEKHRLGNFSWGVAKLEAIGDVESEVSSMSSKYKIPNAYILPIPEDSAVAVGDLVVASQYGNNFDRAYVMEVGDKVKANFIHSMPYGDKSAELKPNKYFKIEGGMQPGSSVAVRMKGLESRSKLEGLDRKVQTFDSFELAAILRVEGEDVLLNGHMGKIFVAPKSALIEIPLAPEVKKGDTVFGIWDTVHFSTGVVKSIDKKLGHYEVAFEGKDKTGMVPFGALLVGKAEDYQ